MDDVVQLLPPFNVIDELGTWMMREEDGKIYKIPFD